MKGLTNVGIVVEDLHTGAQKIGLTEEDIQTDVESKLRLAGMQILTTEQKAKAGAAISFAVVTVTADASSANVSLRLAQDVILYRDSTITLPLAVTWETSSVMSNPNRSRVSDFINDEVDKFLNAWLTANPRHAEIPSPH
jgi:hypothetical protein